MTEASAITAQQDDVSSAPAAVAAQAEQIVRRAGPWLEWLTRTGWAAKGVVYLLMGLTAVNIVRLQPTDDEASPEGALARVMERSGGRLLLLILGVGLLLYVLWRVLTVVMIAGNDLSHWLDRAGYTFSGLFYLALAWTALTSVLRDERPEDGNTIERISRALMDTQWTRVLLGVGGLVTIGVGLYFLVHKAGRRAFTDDLDEVDRTIGANDAYGRAVLLAGVVGWTGRAIVTALVGFFVTRAAVRFDASEARGFDRALNEAATTDLGAVLVGCAAAGLIVYGAYCLLSIPHRCLEIER